MAKKKRKLPLVRKAMNFMAQDTGRVVEGAYCTIAKVGGKEIHRTGRGRDWKERPINPFTGKGYGEYTKVEVKSGRAKQSRLQKETQKKTRKGKYRVVRFGW